MDINKTLENSKIKSTCIYMFESTTV